MHLRPHAAYGSAYRLIGATQMSGRKQDRKWADRNECVKHIATLAPDMQEGAIALACSLYNSSAGTIRADVQRYEAAIAAEIKARRAAEDALLAKQAKQEADKKAASAK